MATTALGPKLPPPARPEPIRVRSLRGFVPPRCLHDGCRLWVEPGDATALDTIEHRTVGMLCGREGPTIVVLRGDRAVGTPRRRGRPRLVEQVERRLRDAGGPLALGQVARAVNRHPDDEAVARALTWLVGTGRAAVVPDAAGAERFRVVGEAGR
jgi:hypothetical protein